MSESGSAKAVEYEVVQAREILGVWRDVEDVVSLSERQAQYYLPPYGEGLRLKSSIGKAAPVKANPVKG